MDANIQETPYNQTGEDDNQFGQQHKEILLQMAEIDSHGLPRLFRSAAE